MATFKVGDKVRIVAQHPGSEVWEVLIGRTGVIASVFSGITSRPYTVRMDTVERREWSMDRVFRSAELAPLTDPKADAFLESIKRLGREPNVTPPAERERITLEDRKSR